jgi:phage tail tape-measure protein
MQVTGKHISMLTYAWRLMPGLGYRTRVRRRSRVGTALRDANRDSNSMAIPALVSAIDFCLYCYKPNSIVKVVVGVGY